MSLFTIFGAWVLACWVVYELTRAPLQPDQPCDDLADVDLNDVHRQRVIAESEPFQVNLRLSRKWVKQ